MRTSFIHTLESIGLQSLDAFWSPLLIWAILALLIMVAIRRSDRLTPRLHYHIRGGLMLSLPVGIMAALIVGWVGGLSTGSETPIAPLIVIDYPFTPTSPVDPGAGPINGFLLLTGGSLLGLFTISLIRIAHLMRHRYQLAASQMKYTDQTTTITERLNEANFDVLGTLRFHPKFLVSRDVEVPYTQGFFRPVIALPEDLMNHDEPLNLAIRHELIHIRRGDALLNWGVLLTHALFWFVPLLYPLHRQFKLYREISCDQEVFGDPELSRKTYAELLVHLSGRTDLHRNLLLGMSVEPSTLKTRINAMQTKQITPTPGKAIYATIGIVMLGILFAMSCTEMQSSQDALTDAQSSTTEAIEAEGVFEQSDVFTVVESMPELIGGLGDLQAKVVYPEQAREAGVEGRVYVQFVVNETGDVESPRVIRGIGSGADEEALRVVREAKFEPGKQRGEPVNVQYSLPIVFELGT
ncbi:MAG: M56 family metallopeptidase [Balneolaceae bacterium]